MTLRLEQLVSGYGPVEVLHGVDLTVPPGATVAVLGPNGAGKTTLLKTAAGVVRARSGRILLHGEDVTEASIERRARAGLCLIPEGRGIFRPLTVRENLAMHRRGRGVTEAIDRAVAHFPVIGERLGQVAGTLSGGQQQMLALARALVSGADVILADELSMGLAPVVVDEIFEAVQELAASGVALLLVEQYVERALAVADYVYVMFKGGITFVGEPDEFRDSDVFEHYLGAVH